MTENLMSGKHSDMDGINIGEGTGGQKIVWHVEEISSYDATNLRSRKVKSKHW